MTDNEKLRKINAHVEAAAMVLLLHLADEKSEDKYDKLYALFVHVLEDIKETIKND